TAGSPGGAGFAQGGGLYLTSSGPADPPFVGVTIQGNTAQGGFGADANNNAPAGNGADGQGGGIFSNLDISFDSTSTLFDNHANGGAGGRGSDGGSQLPA